MPELISQFNCELVGLRRRAFLELLRAFEIQGGTVGRRGRLRLVRRTEFVTFLLRRDEQLEQTAHTDALPGDDYARALGWGGAR